MRTSFWVPIPAKAIPVQIAYEASDSVDLLERTIIKLLAAKPASAAEIARTLGFSDLGGTSAESKVVRRAGEEMVDSALRELADRAIVVASEDDADRYRVSAQTRDVSSDLRDGWAVYVPHSESLLGMLVEGHNLPRLPQVSDGITPNGETALVRQPATADLTRMMLLLSAEGPACWVPERESARSSDGSGGV